MPITAIPLAPLLVPAGYTLDGAWVWSPSACRWFWARLDVVVSYFAPHPDRVFFPTATQTVPISNPPGFTEKNCPPRKWPEELKERAGDLKRDALQDPKSWDVAAELKVLEKRLSLPEQPEGAEPEPANVTAPPALWRPTEESALKYFHTLENDYTRITGKTPEPTPRLRERNRHGGHPVTDCSSPFIPTLRGTRDPDPTQRRHAAYIYGYARALCKICPELAGLEPIKARIPKGFREIYGMGIDAADELLDELQLEMKHWFSEHDYDEETCQPREKVPPPIAKLVPGPPPPPPPPPGAIAYYWRPYCTDAIGGIHIYGDTVITYAVTGEVVQLPPYPPPEPPLDHYCATVCGACPRRWTQVNPPI